MKVIGKSVRYPQFSLKWSWFLWLSWTLMLAYLLLVNGKMTALRSVYLLFGDNSRLLDALGHLVFIFIETNLSYCLLRHYLSRKSAILLTIISVLCAGLAAETGQTLLSSREVDWLDFLANGLAVLLFLPIFCFLNKSQTAEVEAAQKGCVL